VAQVCEVIGHLANGVGDALAEGHADDKGEDAREHSDNQCGVLGRHDGGVELLRVGAGADHPVPGLEVHDAADLLPRPGVAGVLPVILDPAGLADLAVLVAQVLDEQATVSVLGLDDVLAITLAALADGVGAVTLEDKHVAVLAHLCADDALADGADALLRHADIDGTDYLARPRLEGLVGGHVPTVNDLGATAIALAGVDCLSHGAGVGDVGAYRALAVLADDVGRDAQEAPVEALEDRAGAADELLHLVDSRVVS